MSRLLISALDLKLNNLAGASTKGKDRKRRKVQGSQLFNQTTIEHDLLSQVAMKKEGVAVYL